MLRTWGDCYPGGAGRASGRRMAAGCASLAAPVPVRYGPGMDPRTTPAEVTPTGDGRRLRIRWQDGHVSEYPPRHLRLSCRCAGCRDELTGALILRPDAVPADVHPRAIRYVGRYALRFDWSDGHQTGIYPWELLREVCPCPGCRGS